MKPHEYKDLIYLWADGVELQERYIDKENQDLYDWVDFNGDWSWTENYEYRIKPEPKPDVVYLYLAKYDGWLYKKHETEWANLRLTFDGETGELKSAEVLK